MKLTRTIKTEKYEIRRFAGETRLAEMVISESGRVFVELWNNRKHLTVGSDQVLSAQEVMELADNNNVFEGE